jgi:hypothetical protein
MSILVQASLLATNQILVEKAIIHGKNVIQNIFALNAVKEKRYSNKLNLL